MLRKLKKLFPYLISINNNHMLLVNRIITDPYFNIASEEYFLKQMDGEFVMIWQNDPSVVIGKHQNTIAEVNQRYLHKNGIPVIRRISGGGTVYHDNGNLNFTFISKSENKEKLVDFHKYTQPVIDFLATYGITASFSGKNNLIVDGKKFSGNSAHVFKNRVIHHGTILFDSNLDNLEKAITPANFSITDKAVKSIRATVTNICDLLPQKKSITEFRDDFLGFLKENMDITDEYNLSQTNISEIQKLVDEKYTTWEWNYGYSPTYTIENKWDDASISMEVTKGIITEVEFTGKLKGKDLVSNLLVGLPINIESIDNIFTSLGFSNKLVKQYFSLLGLK